MLWQNFFTQTILIRGRDYYRRGKVIGVQSVGDTYVAKVLGSRLYTVVVEERDGALHSATCDCPHSQSGYYCKHIAAVLFAVDEYENTQSAHELEKNPFNDYYQDSDETYRYFDMRRITRNVLIYEETYKRALMLLKSGKVTDVTVNYGCREG